MNIMVSIIIEVFVSFRMLHVPTHLPGTRDSQTIPSQLRMAYIWFSSGCLITGSGARKTHKDTDNLLLSR
jgi:hypothetical protein